MSQYTRKDPPWSHVGAGLNQTLMQQNQSLLGAQPGVVGTPTTNIYGQSMVSNAGLGAAGATTAYPTPQQTMQQRQNMALQQQAAAQNAAAAAAAAGSQGGGTPQLTVSYPTTRATQGNQPRQRVFTGTVTKLHDTFGFVDEDVFFQTNTVKGSMPKIGERVLVEATYNASMPFKWNATRIQLLNSPLEQQVAQPQAPPQQHHAAMKMQQLKQMQLQQQQQQQQPSRNDSVSQQFKMLKQSQQPLLKAPQQGNLMPTHSQPPPPGLLGNPPPLLQQPPQGVVQQPALLQGNAQAMQNLAGAYAHQGRTGQIGQQQAMGRRDFSSSSSSSQSRDRDRDRDRDRERERDRAQRERERERDREHREREREREKERRERGRVRERERSPPSRRSRSPPTRRSRSPVRSKSPRRSPRRTKRLVQRYCVQIPRFALDIPKSDVIELHKRYMNMYIPSDFFVANFAWQDVFPIHRPMSVAQPCTFHIMHKEAPPPQGAATVIDPPDATYSYCAKVMLMSSVSQDELYEKCCARAQDPSEIRDSFQHPTRLINFLVGQKGKNEVMAIGGPWSPSLDGADPVNDTSVLIKTAIRTTKALTGIDLTSCTQWYRFLELSYHRPEETHKGRVIPARIETVVIFVPDVWHILPTKVEWENLTELYKKTLSSKLAAVENRDKKAAEESAAVASATTQEEPSPAKEDEEEKDAEEPEQQTPTNWKDLDPKNMKVSELRQELEIRGLNSKGLKSQLIARLTKMLKNEQENEDAEPVAMETEAASEDAKKEEPKDVSKEEEAVVEKDKEKEKKEKEEKERKEREEEKKKEVMDEEKKRLREREKRDLESRYTMPESPAILVHPSPIAKSGKFDCTQQSLSVLLDYRVEDNKEHSFEVFLFAELFNEMLQRDFAFNMYKAIYRAPEKKEEKKEDKKKDKDKKEEKDKKEDKKEEKKEDKEEKKEEKKEEEPKSKKRKTDDKEADKEETKDKDEEMKEEESKEEDKNGDDEENDGKSNEDDADDDEKKKGDKKSKDDKSKARVKMETHDPHLLLSCIYFDQNHCGYVLERDLEEILYTVGLHLSRAQVRKLLNKVVARDCWSYRKLTDGPKKEKDDTTKVAEVTSGPTDADLAKGNQLILDNMAAAKKGSKGMTADGVTMVKYGGTVIDIANLLKQVQKADQERSMAEKRIESLEKQIGSLKSKASSSEATVSNVSGELMDVQKKLTSSERALIGSSTRSKKLIDVIGTAQKNLDEIMLKFNEVLEEAMLPLPAKVVEKVVEKGKEEAKVKTEAKAKTEAKPAAAAVKVEPKSPKVEK